FNDKVKELAREAGYIGAVSTNPGKSYPSDDPYALKRIRISMSSDNPITFLIETSGYYTFIKEIRDED
ncbi:MAG: polysaccharide deacetylase, partial [Candidatus Omnitrophica bacterium]|nr:polysaccharide deacetylase [Candidatus Omnitrophota bacterium]